MKVSPSVIAGKEEEDPSGYRPQGPAGDSFREARPDI